MHHTTEEVVQIVLWSVCSYLSALITDFLTLLVSISRSARISGELHVILKAYHFVV